MHIIFIPYGKRSEVELLLRDMEAQKHKLTMTKGKKTMKIWIQSQIRYLPFGVMEYICPKEDVDVVLHTLDFKTDRYNLGGFKLAFIRKMVNAQKTPEYKTNLHYLWIKDNVTIIPLGIREDGWLTEEEGKYKGWKHEAI